MRRAATLLVLVACWTQQPVQAPAVQTTKRAPKALPIELETPKPRAAAKEQSAGEIAMDIGKRLRADAASMLPAMIDGPVVMFDLDAQVPSTVCGMAAVREAQRWSQLLIDPSRADPMCLAGPHRRFTCMQQVYPPEELLVIELEGPAPWRIKSVMFGNTNASKSLAGHQQVRSAVSAATCP